MALLEQMHPLSERKRSVSAARMPRPWKTASPFRHFNSPGHLVHRQLRGVSYRLKTGDGRDEIGLLAQEVEQVVPEAVHNFDSHQKGVAYNALIPILVEAVKELSAELDSLRQDRGQPAAG